MNDVPLIQKTDINSINTSIIAIKKQLKQINEAIGLIDTSGGGDTSIYVKKSDVVNVVEADNLNPVTSNAVAQALEDLPQYGTPLGTWASFVNDSAPNGEWLESGSTFNENTYPALAMMLGGNVVPIMYDHDRPSAWETITLPTTSATAITMQYDGQLWLIDNASKTSIYVNGVEEVWQTPTNHTAQLFITFQKGDVIYASKSTIKTRVQYYKHPMFIKATPTSADSDYEGTLNAIREFYVRNNTYSTEERLTGGKWIDGKPIYRKAAHVWHNNAPVSPYTYINSHLSYWPSNEVEMITDYRGISVRTDGYVDIFGSGISVGSGVVPNLTNKNIYYVGLSTTQWRDGWLVMEYTKTTD